MNFKKILNKGRRAKAKRSGFMSGASDTSESLSTSKIDSMKPIQPVQHKSGTGRKQSLVSKVTGFNFDSDPLTGDQKVLVAQAKYKYKTEKQKQKTKRRKYETVAATGTGIGSSTGGSVAGAVAGANQKPDVKTYNYNYFVDPNAGNTNNMVESQDAGTGTTLKYNPPGSEV